MYKVCHVMKHPSFQRILRVGRDGPTPAQRVRLSAMLRDYFRVDVTSDESLNYILRAGMEANRDQNPVPLSSLTDSSRTEKVLAAQPQDPVEALHQIEGQVIKLLHKGTDVLGQMCEDDPEHLKTCKRLLSELRKQKNHSEWLKRMFAEVGETLLTRAIRYGADAEDDHAIEPEDEDEDLSPPGAKGEKGKGKGQPPKGKPAPKGEKGEKGEKAEAAFKEFLATQGRGDLVRAAGRGGSEQNEIAKAAARWMRSNSKRFDKPEFKTTAGETYLQLLWVSGKKGMSLPDYQPFDDYTSEDEHERELEEAEHEDEYLALEHSVEKAGSQAAKDYKKSLSQVLKKFGGLNLKTLKVRFVGDGWFGATVWLK